MAFNTIYLVAPEYVIKELLAFHDEIKFSNSTKSAERHDTLLTNLVLAIRKDIGLSGKDEREQFQFRLIGRKPQ